jgi:carbon storage regulator CsrA
MYFIPRRQGESIVIDENITVTILEVLGDRVRIAIDSPEGTTVQGEGDDLDETDSLAESDEAA